MKNYKKNISNKNRESERGGGDSFAGRRRTTDSGLIISNADVVSP